MRAFISIDPQLFFKGPRKEDRRLGDDARSVDEVELLKLKPGFTLAGYPDEEGIRLSHGRPGAKDAPDEIRRFLYRATVPPRLAPVYDIGNLQLSGTLAERHEEARRWAFQAMQRGHRWIALGGGHDYGYADVGAFLSHCQAAKKRGLILHLDAHLDCRPDDKGLNSGTPFYRVLNEFYGKAKFDLVALGLQRICNSTTYLDWAANRGAHIFFVEQWAQGLKFVRAQLKKNRPVFISLDLDVFSSAYAPGTSNNWPLGLEPRDVWPLYLEILKKSHVVGLGLYEVSPPNDVHSITAKLAAQFAFEMIHHGEPR